MLQGITKVCCELLDLKDAVENICGDMHIKYLTFLRMLSHPRAQTILVDGAFREGEPLIPLPSFKILVLLTFSSPSTGVKRVQTVYPLLKDVALSPDMSFCTYMINSCLQPLIIKSCIALSCTIDNILNPRFIRGYNSLKCNVHYPKIFLLTRTIQMTSLNQPYLFFG
ncbi:unnamed protein product [Brassica rapa subsp. trilocularis]